MHGRQIRSVFYFMQFSILLCVVYRAMDVQENFNFSPKTLSVLFLVSRCTSAKVLAMPLYQLCYQRACTTSNNLIPIRIGAPLNFAPLISTPLIFAQPQISRSFNFRAPLFYCKFAFFSFIRGIFFSSPFNFRPFALRELSPFNFRASQMRKN